MGFLGHVIREEKSEHLSLTRLIPGKRACGRQQQTYRLHDTYDRKAWKKATHETINVWTRTRYKIMMMRAFEERAIYINAESTHKQAFKSTLLMLVLAVEGKT